MVHGLLLLLPLACNAKQVREAVPLRHGPVWLASLDWAALAHISFLDVSTLHLPAMSPPSPLSSQTCSINDIHFWRR